MWLAKLLFEKNHQSTVLGCHLGFVLEKSFIENHYFNPQLGHFLVSFVNLLLKKNSLKKPTLPVLMAFWGVMFYVACKLLFEKKPSKHSFGCHLGFVLEKSFMENHHFNPQLGHFLVSFVNLLLKKHSLKKPTLPVLMAFWGDLLNL